MKAFSSKVKVLFIICFSLISSFAFSQVDKEFWFSVPYASKNHGLNYDALSNKFQMGGNKPIYLRMSTLGSPAVVRVYLPANSAAFDTTITIPANSTATIDLTPYSNVLVVSQAYNTLMSQPVEKKGIHIVSSDLITAYYENATIPNPEIFTLKGANALGTDFYTPFQNHWPNDPLHNYRKLDLKTGTDWHVVSTAGSDSAFSAFDIVATKKGTQVTITPSTDVVGHKANIPFTITLDAGETYSVRQLDQAIDTAYGMYYWAQGDENVYKTVSTKRYTDNLSGSHVTSTNPIAITIKDDSVFPSDITHSGDCEDYVGDQIIPTSVIGKEYMVMRGHLVKPGTDLTDWVFLLGVKDGTSVTVTKSGGQVDTYNIDKGMTLDLPVDTTWMHILSTDSLYAFHISGYNCEFASAILPPINGCTGSNDVGFVRTYGTFNQEKFLVNVLVRQGGETSFTGDPIANIINTTTFTPIPNSAWSVAQIEFTNAQLPIGQHELQNTKTYFHLGLIYSTAFKWIPYNVTAGATPSGWNDGATNTAPELQGASYGYFSNFNVIKPSALISNNGSKVIQIPLGMKVQLGAAGGYKYAWTGFVQNGSNWDAITTPPTYYLNNTTVYNPIFDGTAPEGKYKYKVTITPACDNDYIDSVIIQVIPPIKFTNVNDSICEDTPGSRVGAGYNLFNLNDTIVTKIGKSLNYKVSDWFVKKTGGTSILFDAESNVNVTFSGSVKATLNTAFANPLSNTVNSSTTVLRYSKTGQPSSFDINLKTPITLNQGSSFSLMVRPEPHSSQNNGMNAPIMTLDVWKGTTKTSVSQQITTASWKGQLWEVYTFDFSAYKDATMINKLTLNFTDDWWTGDTKFDIDNITWTSVPHIEKVSDATSHTIHDGDTVYAHITNPQYPAFSDTAKVVFRVMPKGRVSKNITLQPVCATNGKTLECADLTQYKYDVGGAWVANKVWYTDPGLTQAVVDPTCVNVVGNEIFYAKIVDKCGNTGSVTFNVLQVPNVTDSTEVKCADPNGAGNTYSGIILDNYRNYVVAPGNGTPTIDWYPTLVDLNNATNKINSSASMTVSSQVYYANIYYGASVLSSCPKVAKLTFDIKVLQKVDFTVNNLCANSDTAESLIAKPLGGYFSGAGVTGTKFFPGDVGAGPWPVTYTYKIKISDNQYCTTIKTDTIIVYDIPTPAVVVPKFQIPNNSTTQLDVTVTGTPAPYTYVWQPQAYISGSNTVQKPQTINLTSSQQYCVTVTDANKCANFDCKKVSVKNAPLQITITTSDVCLGSPVTLNTSVGGGVVDPTSGNYNYVWSSTPAGYDSYLQSPTFTPTVTGDITFTVTVTDYVGTSSIASRKITVGEAPKVVFPNLTPEVCQNGSLTLLPTVTGDDVNSIYTWSGALVSPNQTTGTKSITLKATQAASLTPYPITFSVKNSINGCSVSQIVNVKINDLPKGIIDPVPGACLAVGLQLNAQASGGTQPYSHNWSGTALNPGDLSDVTIANPIFKSSTFNLYVLTDSVKDNNGCAAAATVSFELNSLPVVSIDTTSSACQVLAGSKLIKSTVTIAPGLTVKNYNWTGNDGVTTVSSITPDYIINLSKSKTVNLNLEVTDNHNCKANVSSVVKVIARPDLTQIVAGSVCQGTDLTLTAFPNNANYSYTWINLSKNIKSSSGATAVYNSSSAFTDNVELLIKDKTSWNTCTLDTTFPVIVKPNPTVTLTDTTICLSSTLTLNPKVNPLVVDKAIWTIDTLTLNNTDRLQPNFNGKEAKDYTLSLNVIKDGCQAADTMVVHVSPLPTATINPVTNPLADLPFTLNASQSTAVGSITNYQWSPISYISGPTTGLTAVITTATISNPQTFILTVTDNNGCKATQSIYVNINNTKPTIVATDTSICGSQTIILHAISGGGDLSTADVFAWYKLPDTITVIGNSASILVTISQTSDYMVTRVNSPYKKVSDIATITVNALPTTSIVPPTPNTVCKGSPMVLSGTNTALSYVWDDGSGFTTKGNTYNYTNLTKTGLSIINVTATDVNNCTVSVPVSITVFPVPTVTVPSKTSLCESKTQLITASTNGGTPSYTYAWSQVAGTDLGESSSSLTYNGLKSGIYNLTVTVTDQNNCTASATDVVTVNSNPPISLPKTATSCSGKDYVLDLYPGGGSKSYHVDWSGDITNTLTIDPTTTKATFNALTSTTALYKIHYSIIDNADPNKCPKEGDIAITVNPMPQLKVSPDVTLCLGSTADLSATSLASIVWDGKGYVSPTQAPTTTFTATAVGIFYVNVSAALVEGCITKDSIKVTVYNKPRAYAGNYPNVPQGGKVTLDKAMAVPGFGVSPFKGQWLNQIDYIDQVVSTDGFKAITKPIFADRTFSIVVTDKNGCTDIAFTTIKSDKQEDFVPVGDTSNKPTDPKNPIDTTDTITYPRNSLKYHNAHICAGNSITLATVVMSAGSGRYSYIWTADNDATFNKTTANIVVSQDPIKKPAYTIYHLQVYDSAYLYKLGPYDFKVYFEESPSVQIRTSIDPKTIVYEMQSITLSGNSQPNSNITRLWSGSKVVLDQKSLNKQYETFTALNKGTYTVSYTVTNQYGCPTTVSKDITVLGRDTINLNTPETVCGDGIVKIYKATTRMAAGTPDPEYKWTIEPPVPFQSSGDNLYIIWKTPGKYVISVEDTSVTSSPKIPAVDTVTVYPALHVTHLIEGPQDVCEYQSAEYTIDTTLFNPKKDGTIQWHIASSDTLIKTNSGSEIGVKWGTFGKDNVYIIASNAGYRGLKNGCRDSVPYPVTIHKLPVADFYARSIDSATDKQIYANHIVDFDNRSYVYSPLEIDQKGLQYYWDFVGDGVYVEDKFEPKYSYDEKGTFNPSLIAVDTTWGCRDTISKPVVVVQNPHCAIKFPNAFTPEAKSDKGFSYGYSEGLVDKDFDLQVFNRWGQLIWETTNRFEKWDGTYKGEICKQDVYVYHSTATCENGKVIKTNGDVTLIK